MIISVEIFFSETSGHPTSIGVTPENAASKTKKNSRGIGIFCQLWLS